MHIPDLLAECQLEAHIQPGMSYKRAEADDEDGRARFDWTFNAVLDLADQIIDGAPGYLAGVGAAISAAENGDGSSTISHEPLDNRRYTRLILDNRSDDPGDFALSTHAEVRHLQVNAIKGASRFRARIKVFDLSSTDSATLLECSGKGVRLSLQPTNEPFTLEAPTSQGGQAQLPPEPVA